MSEIPIGSPPAPPGRHAAPPGWYADPLDHALERYWDGWQWSRTTRPGEHVRPPVSGSQPHQPGPSAAHGDTAHRPSGPAGTNRGTSGHGSGWRASGTVPGTPGGGFATSAPGTQQMLTADGVPMAAWGLRAVAAVIDLLVVGIVTSVVSLPIYRPMIAVVVANVQQAADAARRGAAAPPSPSYTQLLNSLTATDRMVLTLISGVVGVLYFALLWRLRSATVGQLIFGLRVVPVDQAQDVPKISWSSAVVRALVWVVPRLSAYLVLFWLLNCLFPLWNAKRQALHDLAARTQVVKIR